jgi:DNA-binding protein HU-beta
MTKAELALAVAKQTGFDKKDTLTTIESMMAIIKKTNAENEGVYLRGLGSFIVKKRAAKTGRNISLNTEVHIKAHCVPIFRPAKIFKAEIGRKVKV